MELWMGLSLYVIGWLTGWFARVLLEINKEEEKVIREVKSKGKENE
jgi:hypothetical protein